MGDRARTPSLGSDQIIRALERLGFVKPKAKAGSHMTMHNSDTKRSCTVVTGKDKDYPKATLESALEQAGVALSDFLLACGGKLAREEKRRLRRVKN